MESNTPTVQTGPPGPQAGNPSETIMRLAMGSMVTQAIHVAAKLGIADLLKDGPKKVGDLARESKTHEQTLYRLLRALSGLGVFHELPGKRFEQSPMSELLRSDHPRSIRFGAMLVGSGFHWNAWGNLLHAVETGKSSFEFIHGKKFFDYLSGHSEDYELFNGWMTQASGMQIPEIIKGYDFSACGKIVDVGGGNGHLLSAILKVSPKSRGVLFDLPEALTKARAFLQSEGVAERCDIVGGNFFESVPDGGGLYILKYVLHDFSDKLSLDILGNCIKAMGAGSRLLIIESLVPDANVAHPSKMMDLNMAVLNDGGLERTEAEFRNLLERAGLRISKIVRIAAPVSIIEVELAK